MTHQSRILNLLILVLAFSLFASGQARDVSGSIKVSRCDQCADIAVKLPEVQYPYVGYGAHTYEGEVGIRVVISENGHVESAKGISGHPYFRPMLVKASLTAEFEPITEKRKAVIFYQITPSKVEPQADASPLKLGIINGRARSLPKPAYSQFHRNLCSYGKVEVEVELDVRGIVTEAKVISGDELMHQIALDAAKLAEFSTPLSQKVSSKGIIVYNFPAENECQIEGIFNHKALTKPIPPFNQHLRIREETELRVRVIIEENGSVVSTRTLSGHPLMRVAVENAARQTKFPVGMVKGTGRISATLVYVAKPDRTLQLGTTISH